MSFTDLWYSTTEREWNLLLRAYWSYVKPGNIQVEYTLSRLTPERLAAMGEVEWFEFLHDEYFVWKYTAPNRLTR